MSQKLQTLGEKNLWMYLLPMTLDRMEPEETLCGLPPLTHDIIWKASFSVSRGVFKFTNHRFANRLL